MIKFVADNIVCLGFTKLDIDKLIAGKPVLISGSSVKGNYNIFICSGNDDFEIFSKLQQSNFIENNCELIPSNKL